MCSDTVWEGELGLGWSDNLCIACLVKRLGREPQCFTDIFPANSVVTLSKRMLQIIRAMQVTKIKRKKNERR